MISRQGPRHTLSLHPLHSRVRQRSMDLTVTLQEGVLFVGEGDRTVEIKLVKLCGGE